MSTTKLYCGIDVSKDTLDVCYQNNLGHLFHLKVPNNKKGFALILYHTGAGYHFVMEVTGVYYISLAFFLHDKGCDISVVGGLTIKRYIQMQGERNKTDKKDAGWILRYGAEQAPALWQMPAPAYFEAKQLYNTIRTYSEQTKTFTNQIHSLRLLPVQSKEAIKSLEKMVREMKSQTKLLEASLHKVLEGWQPAQLKSIGSVMSIGKRATAMLIVYTQGFKNTQSYRQLISFSGLCPVEKSSGTSIHARAKIGRQGGKEIRDVLYMCAMNAIRNNVACKQLYERLRAKGKPGKLALIAVCNKLLKQVYAVVRSGSLYQPNYSSVRP